MYFTIVGTTHYYGTSFMEKGMEVRLYHDVDNKHDREAIRVEVEGLGKIGYVANSPYTVLGESFSAGRMYDKIDDGDVGHILYITSKGVLGQIDIGTEELDEISF